MLNYKTFRVLKVCERNIHIFLTNTKKLSVLKEGRHIFVFGCNYLAHTESPVYLSFPGVVGLGHLRVSAGEESSLESVAALHDFAKMVRFSDFLYFLKIDQNRPIFAKLVLGHQRRYSGSVFSYDQGTIHSFQKSWCRIISI